LVPSGVLQGSGGTTEIMKEILGRSLSLQPDLAIYDTCAPGS
jgi:hypothetical protein